MNKYRLYAIDESAKSHINSNSCISYQEEAKLTSQRKIEREKQLDKLISEKAIVDRGVGSWFRFFNCHVENKIGIININDELCHDAGWYGISYKEILFAIKSFEEDGEIDNIILDINSPGGEVAGLLELAKEIKSCTKPIYSYCEGLTASAAMLIASCSKRIYATQSTVLGSIGVMAVAYKYDKAYEKAGIEKKIFRSPNAFNKNLDPFEKAGEEELSKSIEETEGYFLKTLADNRGVAPDDAIKKFGQGLTFHAEEGIERGLADEIVSDFDDCVAKILPSETEGGGIMMASEKFTIETLKTQYPELTGSLVKEGYDDGYKEGKKDGIAEGVVQGNAEGAASERKRVTALEELRGTSVVADSIIAKAITDGDTAEKACVSIVKKQKENPQPTISNELTKVDDLEKESADDNIVPLVLAKTKATEIQAATARAVDLIEKNSAKKKA